MKDFQNFICRDNALFNLGQENWNVEDALENLFRSLGINHDTKLGGQSNVSTTNMTGMQMVESFDIDRSWVLYRLVNCNATINFIILYQVILRPMQLTHPIL